MRLKFSLITILFCGFVLQGSAFEFSWQIDETPEGSESATVVEPVQVILLDTVTDVPAHSASLALMRKYSVHLGPEWSQAHAYRLLQTFESIPQRTNNLYNENLDVPASVWMLTNRHLQDDISIEYHNDQRIVTIAEDAFVHATPLLAEIDGIRGRYFSKRLHRAVVRFVTDNGTDRRALERILQERYAVSVNIPDYTELTRHTTGEHAGRFEDFKNEELIAIASMLEEFPSGMHQTQGLKYLLRRLDGTVHPTHPTAAAVAWTGTGYIEFMEIAFKDTGAEAMHRLILHEKAHFLWTHLFDEQLKRDWIELGDWYENPEDKDGWSTTQQTEFVSAYAHDINPDEDMAESISHYVVNPDKLRSRASDKYEFIQNRVMHGTRYISRIREDLTFQVYNLYPDYIYPGRVIRVDVSVTGEPKEDKQLTIEIELHHENALDVATGAWINILNPKGINIGKSMHPIDPEGNRVSEGYILRSQRTISKYAASGYAVMDAMGIYDGVGNRRLKSNDFGLKVYIDNPLADCEPPEYVPNSLQLSLSDAQTDDGQAYQILTVDWQLIEENELKGLRAAVDNDNPESYSTKSQWAWGKDGYNPETGEARVQVTFPEYWDGGTYAVHYLEMSDIAGNVRGVYFSQYPKGASGDKIKLDELSPSVEIITPNPDTTPPVLDINNIAIIAEPTRPDDPNGETRVDITFSIKDDISGYNGSNIGLRDPLGTMHWDGHAPHKHGYSQMYFLGDPTVYTRYESTIVLPIGSVPGTWGLAEMTVKDKAQNAQRYDFTEIVRFEVTEETPFDLNADGEINILDLVIVANAIGTDDSDADVNGDGIVNILDLVQVANHI